MEQIEEEWSILNQELDEAQYVLIDWMVTNRVFKRSSKRGQMLASRWEVPEQRSAIDNITKFCWMGRDYLSGVSFRGKKMQTGTRRSWIQKHLRKHLEFHSLQSLKRFPVQKLAFLIDYSWFSVSNTNCKSICRFWSPLELNDLTMVRHDLTWRDTSIDVIKHANFSLSIMDVCTIFLIFDFPFFAL